MPGEALVLDPVSEDAANTELVLSEANGYRLMAHSYPDPSEDTQWAGNVDTDGDFRAAGKPQNREIPLKIRVFGTTDAAFRTAQRNLDKKLGKLRREGGTLKRTLPNGDVIVFDVHTVSGGERLFDNRFIANKRTEDTITLTCQPYGRGAAQVYSVISEASLPVWRGTFSGVKGDVDGLGRAVIDEQQAADQPWFHWGIRQRYYSASANNALFYEAESRTVQGGATVVTGTSPASGGGSNNVVRQGTLTPGWQSMLSTQATGGGAHLEHIGVYEVWARVFMPTTNTGAVSIRFDWAEGDFRKVTPNPQVDFAADHSREGKWILVNLGQVFLTKVAQGTQRWEGRIVAKSTVTGDDLDVDCFWLRPMSEGNGTARAIVTFDAPTSFTRRDEFDQTAGSLTGKSLPVGGSWTAFVGDTDDFTMDTTGATAQRTTTSDTALLGASVNGRAITAGTGTMTAMAAQVDFKWSAALSSSGVSGLIVRAVNTTNFGLVYVDGGGGSNRANIWFRKLIASVAGDLAPVKTTSLTLVPGTFYSLRVTVATNGQFMVWLWPTGGAQGDPQVIGQDALLATGGTLANGMVGLADGNQGGTACTRNYDNFQAWVPPADAAIFASRSAEIRHDRVIRQDASGTIWTNVSDYEGDFLRIPPAGMEGRVSEILLKASRNDPAFGEDSAIDDIRVTLTVIPRYLKVPEP